MAAKLYGIQESSFVDDVIFTQLPGQAWGRCPIYMPNMQRGLGEWADGAGGRDKRGLNLK